MGIVLDVIIIAIVAVTALLSAKRGFVRTAVELVGFVLAIYLSFAISLPAANYTYDSIIGPKIISAIENSAVDTAGDIGGNVWDSLPDFIAKGAEKFGVSRSEVESAVSGSSANGAAAIAKTVSDSTVKPVIVSITRLVIGILLFSVLTFLVKLLARILNKAFSIPLVGTLNRTLGLVLGAFKGIVYAAVFCALVTLISSFVKDGFFVFSAEAVENSAICRLLMGITGIKLFKM